MGGMNIAEFVAELIAGTRASQCICIPPAEPLLELLMTIAIVSAPPESAPLLAMNAATGTNDASPEQDFISLLLGQLAARPDAGPILDAASATTNDDGDSGSLDDGNAEAGDPSELLAALAQAPLEQRVSPVIPAEERILAADRPAPEPLQAKPALTTEPAPKTAPELSANERVPATVQPEPESLQAKPAPVNEAAAKFAARLDTASGKNAPISQESAGSANIATVAAGVPVRRDEPAPTIAIPTPLHDRGWNTDFAQKVTWVATHHNQFAELTLNPPAMGSIEISLKLDNDKSTATAFFVSGNAEVRETIETALPKLREMLAGIGIALGEAQVGAESFRQAAGDGRQAGDDASSSSNDAAILAPDPRVDWNAAPVAGAGRGLVDMFV
jgi:flagellar hook-length control protein FliK